MSGGLMLVAVSAQAQAQGEGAAVPQATSQAGAEDVAAEFAQDGAQAEEKAGPEGGEARAAEEAVRTMEALLDGAVSRPDAPVAARPQPAAPGGLPQQPQAEALAKIAKRLVPAIRGCAMGASGRADLIVVLQSNGQVERVKVSNPPFAGTPSGQCMEGVMRRTRFPAFQLPLFRLRVPYELQ